MQQGTRGDGRRRGWRGAAAAVVAAMVASVVAVPAIADDDGIKVAGDPVAAQVWTTWVLDGDALEGEAGDGVLDPARATVAAAAGIGVEDLEVEAVVTLTDDTVVRASDRTVTELPPGTQVEHVASWTAEVRGLATSICAPTLQDDELPPPVPDTDLTASSAVVTGTGRLGKDDGYGFTLQVVDGGSGGPDTLHLEIIAPDGTTVVYDTVAAVPLGGGNVTVHPPRGRLHAR